MILKLSKKKRTNRQKKEKEAVWVTPLKTPLLPHIILLFLVIVNIKFSRLRNNRNDSHRQPPCAPVWHFAGWVETNTRLRRLQAELRIYRKRLNRQKHMDFKKVS